MRISRRNHFCAVNYILTVVIDSPDVLLSVQQNLQTISYLMLTSWHIGRLIPFLHAVRPQVEWDL